MSFIGLDGEPSYIDADLNFKDLPDLGIMFTKREKEVLSLLGKGKSSDQIARMLGLIKETVNTYRRKLLYKANAISVDELIRYGV